MFDPHDVSQEDTAHGPHGYGLCVFGSFFHSPSPRPGIAPCSVAVLIKVHRSEVDWDVVGFRQKEHHCVSFSLARLKFKVEDSCFPEFERKQSFSCRPSLVL